jgi:hypothetical protein
LIGGYNEEENKMREFKTVKEYIEYTTGLKVGTGKHDVEIISFFKDMETSINKARTVLVINYLEYSSEMRNPYLVVTTALGELLHPTSKGNGDVEEMYMLVNLFMNEFNGPISNSFLKIMVQYEKAIIKNKGIIARVRRKLGI